MPVYNRDMHNWIELSGKTISASLCLISSSTNSSSSRMNCSSGNEKINLTAIRDAQGIQEKHFFGSLTCFLALRNGPKAVIDVGSGAGFPRFAS